MKFELCGTLCKIKNVFNSLNSKKFSIQEFETLDVKEIFEQIKQTNLEINTKQNVNYNNYELDYFDDYSSHIVENNDYKLFSFEENATFSKNDVIIYNNNEYDIKKIKYDIQNKTFKLYIDYSLILEEENKRHKNLCEKLKKVNNLITEYNKSLKLLKKLENDQE